MQSDRLRLWNKILHQNRNHNNPRNKQSESKEPQLGKKEISAPNKSREM